MLPLGLPFSWSAARLNRASRRRHGKAHFRVERKLGQIVQCSPELFESGTHSRASPSSTPTLNSSTSPIPNSAPSNTHVSFDGTSRSRSSLSPSFTSRQSHRKKIRRYSEEAFQPLFEENENKDDVNDSLQFQHLESKYYTLREVPEYKNKNTKTLDSHSSLDNDIQ